MTWILLIVIVIIILIPLGLIIKNSTSGKGFDDQYVNSYVEKFFDLKNTVNERISDEAYRSTKINPLEGRIIFITTYHYQNPAKIIASLKETEPGTTMVILDGEPMNLSDIYLDNNDIVISGKTSNLPYNGRKIYYPYYAYHLLVNNKSNINPNQLIKDKNWETPLKSKFCAFAYSNCDEQFKGVILRKNFFYILQELSEGKVDNFGKCYNRFFPAKGSHHSNTDMFKEYKFVIAIENEPINGYITEKLVNPMIAGCIPIYYGAPDVGDHFNTKSFINMRDFNTLEECAEYVLRVNNDDSLYHAMLKEPWLKDNKLNKYLDNVLDDNSYIKKQLTKTMTNSSFIKK